MPLAKQLRIAAFIAVVGIGLAIAATIPTRVESAKESPGSVNAAAPPAVVEPIPGADVDRVTLTAQAAKRLDIQTAPVRDEMIGGTPRTPSR